MVRQKKKFLVILTVLIVVNIIIFFSISKFNSLNNDYRINNYFILIIILLIFTDYIFFNALIKNLFKKFNNYCLALLTYLPVILLLFTEYFYLNISYPIRDFRNLLGSLKFLYGFTFIGFVFLKVFFIIFIFKKYKPEIKAYKIIILVIYILSFFSLWEYFQPARGDEIEYYINIHSMTYEKNLNIYNDVLYREIICGTTTLPVISVHKPNVFITQHSSNILFHLLFIIPYYLLKRYGVMLMLNLFFALTFFQIFKFLKYNYLTFIILLFPAFSIYSTKLYPEIFPVLLLLYFLNNYNDIKNNPIKYGFINGIILLLNLRFIIISCGIALWFFIKIKKIKNKIFFCVPIIIFVLMHLTFNYIVYGCFSIAANTGGKEFNNFTFNIFNTFLKLFFDQEYGLFLFNPVIILFFTALYATIKIKELHFVFFTLIIYILFISCYGNNWWGGVSPPFRFLFPFVMTYYLIYIYFTTQIDKKKVLLFVSYLLNITTIIISYILMSVPNFQYTERWRGTNQILEKINWYTGINLLNFFPGYFRNLNTETAYYWIGIIVLLNVITMKIFKNNN